MTRRSHSLWAGAVLVLAIAFTASTAASQPRIELGAPEWNFGDIPRDSVVDYRLRIANAGDEPLTIDHVRSSCACLLIVFSPASIDPGRSIEVPLRYVPDKRKGETAKTVFIESRDPTNPSLRFTVRGNILEARDAEITIEPDPCYIEAPPGEVVEQELLLRNAGRGALEIRSLRGIGCEVDPPALTRLDPGSSVGFRVRLRPDELHGFNHFVVAESNDPTEPFLLVPVYPLTEDEPAAGDRLAALGASPEDTVRAVLFASLECPHCLALKTSYFPRIEEFFEGRFSVEFAYVDRDENYRWLVDVERKVGDTGNDIPALVVGSRILGGPEEILARAPAVLDSAFAAHGTSLPARPQASPEIAGAGADTVYLAYFRKPGCKECDRVRFLLDRLEKRFSPLVVRTYDVTRPSDQEMNEALCEAYGVPQDRRLLAPSLFGGGRYLIRGDLDDRGAEEMISALAPRGARPPWEEAEHYRTEARESIVGRFRSLGPLTVVLGGLVDGVNPCAFATIIFFVSYLAFIGRSGREILWIGGTFTFAVFLTYLLVGLGALTFLQSLSAFRPVSLVVYGLTAALAVALGIYSLVDFVRIRRGRTAEVALQLPGFLKRRIHKEIRERARMRRFIPAAFATGAVVSLLELACTGQVYLPTICFVTGIPELRAHAVAYLVLYNVMFVVPLVAVFAVSYYGMTSRQLAGFFGRHAAAVKLATSVFFFALAALLLSTLL